MSNLDVLFINIEEMTSSPTNMHEFCLHLFCFGLRLNLYFNSPALVSVRDNDIPKQVNPILYQSGKNRFLEMSKLCQIHFVNISEVFFAFYILSKTFNVSNL